MYSLVKTTASAWSQHTTQILNRWEPCATKLQKQEKWGEKNFQETKPQRLSTLKD